MSQFLTNITDFLVPSTLIKIIRKTYKTVNNFDNYSFFLKCVCQKGISDSLSRTLQAYSSRVIATAL